MNEEEQALASFFYEAVNNFSRTSERSEQAKTFRAGMSDLGYCSERLRRTLAQEVPENTDELLTFIGTALGDYIEKAAKKVQQRLIIQSEVTLELAGQYGTYTLMGHPDVVDPEEGLVVDVKTKRGLSIVEKTGPSQSYQWQRMLYAKACHQAGMFPNHTLDQIRVANVWFDRSGEERRAHVEMQPYSEEAVEDAVMWLDDVIYAYINGEEARKEPDRVVCETTCGYFKTCRLYDTDVEGLLKDVEIVAAVDEYAEGSALVREGERKKRMAKAHLHNISGATDRHLVRWTWVNGSRVEFDREGYNKLTITPRKDVVKKEK